MLVSFSVENWMSFRNRSTLSLLATRERQHGERVPVVSKYDVRVLPIAIIYGGNASGKSNLYRAMIFVRELVTKVTSPSSLIPVDPFRLDTATGKSPSKFAVEMLVDDVLYEFSFSVTRQSVIEEKLIERTKTSDKVIYHRSLSQPPIFDAGCRKDEALQYAFRGTRDNQLFLTNSVSQKIDRFKPIYDWFDGLRFVSPDARYGRLASALTEEDPLYSAMNSVLPLLDTGIAHLNGEVVPLDSLSISDVVKADLNEGLKEGMSSRIIQLSGGDLELFDVTRKKDELIARKVTTYHLGTDGSEVKFEFRQESDGSQRVINLLPAFLLSSAKGSKKVFVIDEVNRSLHTLLTRRLIEAFLCSCSPDSRAQLILTTHDVLLMDQELFRRDEMWITERGTSGASRLFSLSEYKDVRYDKDVRKSYLQGRLGGIPRLLLRSMPTEPIDKENGGGGQLR